MADINRSVETNVVHFYREHSDLTDHSVDKIYDGLIRLYQNEQRGKEEPKLRLTDEERELFDSVRVVCEQQLGRAEVDNAVPPATIDELISALKQLRTSIQRWTGKSRGRQGYLTYINSFIA